MEEGYPPVNEGGLSWLCPCWRGGAWASLVGERSGPEALFEEAGGASFGALGAAAGETALSALRGLFPEKTDSLAGQGLIGAKELPAWVPPKPLPLPVPPLAPWLGIFAFPSATFPEVPGEAGEGEGRAMLLPSGRLFVVPDWSCFDPKPPLVGILGPVSEEGVPREPLPSASAPAGFGTAEAVGFPEEPPEEEPVDFPSALAVACLSSWLPPPSGNRLIRSAPSTTINTKTTANPIFISRVKRGLSSASSISDSSI